MFFNGQNWHVTGCEKEQISKLKELSTNTVLYLWFLSRGQQMGVFRWGYLWHKSIGCLCHGLTLGALLLKPFSNIDDIMPKITKKETKKYPQLNHPLKKIKFINKRFPMPQFIFLGEVCSFWETDALLHLLYLMEITTPVCNHCTGFSCFMTLNLSHRAEWHILIFHR